MVADFLAELDLHDVTLVCNDWGGAHLVVSPGGRTVSPISRGSWSGTHCEFHARMRAIAGFSCCERATWRRVSVRSAPRPERPFAQVKLSLHYNSSCPVCVRQAARTARLDWCRAIEFRTDPSPLGEVPVGEIVVVDKRSRRVFTGVHATRKVCLRIPLLLLYGLLLYIPPIRSLAGKSNPGRNGDACDV